MSSAEASDNSLWISINQLAQRAGISTPVMSRRIKHLEEQGLIETRPGRQGAKLVNIAAYDRIRGKTIDGVRAVNARASRGADVAFGAVGGLSPDPEEKVLSREQARRVSYQAELARLDLEERLGKVVPIDGVRDAIAKCAEKIVSAFESVPGKADELAAAVGKDGIQGARIFLKTYKGELRRAVAAALRSLAEEGLAAHAVAKVPGESAGAEAS